MIRAYCFVALLFGAMFLTQAIVPNLRRKFYTEPVHVAYAMFATVAWPLFAWIFVRTFWGELRRAWR